jgi:glycosyltransferase involved in cell wall biosynthesis
MRILYVSDAQSTHTRQWAETFRDEGDEVHVASFRPANIAGVTVHVLPTAGLGRAGYMLAVPTLHRLFATLRPDIVHAQYVTSYGFIAAMARLKPLVVTAWGTDVLISPRESRLSRWLAQRAFAGADQVTTVAEHMNAAVAALGVPKEKIMALPFGVDTVQFCQPVALRPEPPPVRIISTRNFAPVYSVHTVVEAVRRVHARGTSVRLALVGAGPLRAEIEAQVREAGLDKLVEFHGFVDHPRLVALLGASHVFISSALSDGNNVSLNEAMACGCFPLATDIPANAQWINDGSNGGLFPAGDAQRLASWIERAAADTALRLAASIANRRIIEDRADWRVGVKRMRDLYQRLASHCALSKGEMG